MGLGKLSSLFLFVAVGLSVFFKWPPPRMSQSLTIWKNSGHYFTYFDNLIFYKDSKGQVDNVLIFLHGFPTMSFDWNKVWDDISSRGMFSRLIAMDFVGFGFSDKPYMHSYSLFEQADIVESLLVSLDVNSVHLMAHDYGDTVAQELLARYEDRRKNNKKGLVLKSLCLSNGGIFPETNHPKLSQKAMLIPIVGPLLSLLMNYYTFRHEFGHVFGPRTFLAEEEFRDFWAGIRYNEQNFITHKLMRYIIERRENRERWVGHLQTTSVPVHMIYGPADIINPPPFINHYKKLIRNGSISVLDAGIGHYPQWEAPDKFVREYISFVERINAK